VRHDAGYFREEPGAGKPHARICEGEAEWPSYSTNLSKSESVTIAAIEEGVPSLVEAREVIADFHGMVRARAEAQLPAWIDGAANSLVGSFANGIRRDITAVHAAISSPWSNGQTEGQVTRLKLVKRQMYGRAKLDLIEARLIGAA